MAVDKVINVYDLESKGFEQSVNKVKAGYDKLQREQLKLKTELKAIQKEEKRLTQLQAEGSKNAEKRLKRVRGLLIENKNQQKKVTEEIRKTERAQKDSVKQAEKGGAAFKKLGGIIAGAFAITQLIKFGKELNTLAVQGEAFQNRAKVVFGESAKFVEAFADKSAISLGLTKNEFLGAAAAIGDILVPLGLSRAAAAQMSTEAVRLGTALKRFSGDQRSAAEISSIVARALTGEVEGLKGLGIIVQQNTKEFKALQAQKLKDGAATESQAKALAIYETVALSATDATTNLENAGDSLLAQQDQLAAQFRQVKEDLATGSIPVIQRLAKELRVFFSDDLSAKQKIFWSVNKASDYLDVIEKVRFEHEQLRNILDQGFAGEFIKGLFDSFLGVTELLPKLTVATETQIETIDSLNKELSELKKAYSATDLTLTASLATQKKDIETKQARIKALTSLVEKKKELVLTLSEQWEAEQKLRNSALDFGEGQAKVDKKIADDKEKADKKAADKEAEKINADNEAAQAGANFFAQIEQDKRDDIEKTALLREEKQILLLQSTQNLVSAISNLQNVALENELKLAGDNDAAKEAIEKKYFARQKALAVAQATIDGVLAVQKIAADVPKADFGITTAILIGLSIAASAANIAAISSQQFAEGVIDLQGKGTETSDSIPAMLSKHESVMTAKETHRYRDELQGMRDGTFDNLIYEKYAKPTKQGYGENAFNSLSLQAELNDDRILRKLSLGNMMSKKNTDRLISALTQRHKVR